MTTDWDRPRQRYVVLENFVDPGDPQWLELHPYGANAWQEISPSKEIRIYPTVELAAADGMPIAKRWLSAHLCPFSINEDFLEMTRTEGGKYGPPVWDLEWA